MTKKIGLIIGTTRQNRISPTIASWIEAQVAKNQDFELTTLDLKEINLPFFDEPTTPSVAVGTSDAAQNWSKTIQGFDAFIVLSAEYNAGYPAPLKNAIDYLKNDWLNRPVFIVSYGWSGGVSAAHQLTEVFNRIGAPVIEPGIAIQFGDKLNEQGGMDEPHDKLAVHDEELALGLKAILEFVPVTEA